MKHTMEENYIFFFCCVFSLVVLFVNTSCGVFHYYSRVEEEREKKELKKNLRRGFYYIHPGEGASKQHNKQQNTFCSRSCDRLRRRWRRKKWKRILDVGCARGAWKKKISVSFQIHNENNVELSIRRHHLLHDSSGLLLFEPSLVFLWLNFNNIHNAMNGRVMAV